MAEFIVRKFNERKLKLSKSRMLGSSLQEPMILLWSSAPAHDYSYYLPPSYVDGVHYYGGMSKAIEESYVDSDNYMMSYSEFFDSLFSHGPYKVGSSDVNQYQKAVYGESQESFKITN